MSTRAERLEQEYLKTLSSLLKTTKKKKGQVGTCALGGFVRALIDECSSMNLKTAQELFKIAEELEELH